MKLDLSAVWNAYQGLGDESEDRRPGYSQKELARDYPEFNEREIDYFYRLCSTQNDSQIANLYCSHWAPEDAQRLAGIITESIHQNYDGWDDHDKVIITLYLQDLGLALRASQEQEPPKET